MSGFPIYEKLGGEDAALELASKRANREISGSARRKWREFGRLPDWMALQLAYVCQERRIEFTPDDFIFKNGG